MNPKLVRETSPYLRKPISVMRMMIDVLIALIPVVIFSAIISKGQSLLVILISLIVMIGTELLFHRITKRQITINAVLAPAISAIIFAMLIPEVSWVSFPKMIYVVIIGSFAGIFLGKLVFGGLGGNIFNPAATGRIFATIAFSGVFVYASQGYYDTVAGATALQMISSDIGNLSTALQSYSLWDLFIGRVPGSMGEGSAIAIIIGGAYLFIRKSADFRVTLSLLGSFIILIMIAGVAYNINGGSINIFELVCFELLGGGLLFGAVFMATDPVTSPVTKMGRIVYGSMMGAIVVFIRLFGSYPEGMAFAILIMNMFVPLIDMLSKTKYSVEGFTKLGLFFILLMGVIIQYYIDNIFFLVSVISFVIIAIVILIYLKKRVKGGVVKV